MADRGNAASNRFEARARLYLTMADSQAQRIAQGWDETPADSKKLSPDELRQLWNYSPSPQPEQDFWSAHDQALAQAMSGLQDPTDPEQVQNAHSQAENKALESTYPWRAQLLGVGTAGIDEQIRRAAQLSKLVGDAHANQGDEEHDQSPSTAASSAYPPIGGA